MNAKVSSFVDRQKKWKAACEQLRTQMLECALTEELKWGKPCYCVGTKNIVLIQPFKEYCALLFFKGALLTDPMGLLVAPGQTQAARQMRFNSLEDVIANKAAIKAFVREAIAVEEAGLKVKLKSHSEYTLPEELQTKLAETPTLKQAFEELTPGRQRGYILHISAAKQAATRKARVEKCMPAILAGKGFNE